MDSSTSPVYLIQESNPFRVYPQRFWVLFIFVFLSFNQCMFWLTFSPISSSTRGFFHVDEATVDLLLNWGPIIFLPTLPFAYILLNTHHGLRKCVLILAIVPLIATCLRLIPLIVVSSSKSNFHDVALPFLHIGQILNAATGPIAMGLVSQLSCIWFAPNERTRATTIAILGVNLGGAAGFLVSPLLIWKPEQVPRILYLHTGQAVLACILTLIYFPAEPPTPPSVAADMLKANRFIKHRPIETLQNVLRDTWRCCRNISCVLMIAAGSIMGGTFSAWGGLFANILTPLNYTEVEAGWFGFGQTVANMGGSLAMGYIGDQPRFQRSFKPLILISLTLCFLFCFFFQLSVRTLMWPSRALIKSSSASIGILLSITGFFYGAALPLFYESLAEMVHPLPESLSTSILVQFFNAVALIFLAIAPGRGDLVNLLVLIMIAVSITMVACARITYRRKDGEEAKLARERMYETSRDMINA